LHEAQQGRATDLYPVTLSTVLSENGLLMQDGIGYFLNIKIYAPFWEIN
jgi:hypothetical protein